MQETQETQIRPLGLEDPLEKGMATHSSFLAWTVPWTEEPGGLQSMGLQRIGHNLATKQRQIDFSESSNSYSVHPATFHMPHGIFVL